SSRVEHQRELFIGQLLRRCKLARDKLAKSCLRRKSMIEKDSHPFALLRIGAGPEFSRASQALVGQTAIVGCQLGELVEDFLGGAIGHGVTEPAGKVAKDLPVEPCLARRLEDLSADLHAAVGIGVSP